MSRFLLRAICLLCGYCCMGVLTIQANTDDYEFPLTNAFEATVFGTPKAFKADLPPLDELDRTEHKLDLYPDQRVPDVFWHNEEFRFTAVVQDKPAPLVFSIGGTGASHNGSKLKNLERAFHSAGYHVISLSSPTHPNFIIAASQEKMPGALPVDSEELYQVMQKTLAHVQQEEGEDFQVTDYYLTGYSLGGAQAAFISMLDEEQKVFNFSKVYMVNPPVSLYNSVVRLDGYIENYGGVETVPEFIDEVFASLGERASHEDKFELSPEFIYSAYKSGDATEEDLARLIGIAFRLSSIDMIYAIDLMGNFGWVSYKNHNVGKFESVTHSMRRASDISFVRYFDNAMLPHYQAIKPDLTREYAINAMSLTYIEDYLKQADKIHVVHNRDDVILTEGEVVFFEQTFGQRATIYPHGGHCGNMDERVWVADMLRFFTGNQG